MIKEKYKRYGDDRIAKRFLNFLGLAQENSEEALRGEAAFVLRNQYLTYIQKGHLDRSYEEYNPGAGRKYKRGQIMKAIN